MKMEIERVVSLKRSRREERLEKKADRGRL